VVVTMTVTVPAATVLPDDALRIVMRWADKENRAAAA
jgi:hypothetical protein